MSDESTVPTAAAAPAPTVPAAPESKEQNLDWLPARLEQAKSSAKSELLKALGASNEEEVKAAMAELNAKRDAEKTLIEKHADLATKHAAAEAEKARVTGVLSGFAARMFEGLSDAEKAIVKDACGDDVAKQVEFIPKLASLAKAVAPAATAAAAPAAPPPVVNTAPPANAPHGAETTPQNAREIYERTRTSNPFASAAFGLQNRDAYKPQG